MVTKNLKENGVDNGAKWVRFGGNLVISRRFEDILEAFGDREFEFRAPKWVQSIHLAYMECN